MRRVCADTKHPMRRYFAETRAQAAGRVRREPDAADGGASHRLRPPFLRGSHSRRCRRQTLGTYTNRCFLLYTASSLLSLSPRTTSYRGLLSGCSGSTDVSKGPCMRLLSLSVHVVMGSTRGTSGLVTFLIAYGFVRAKALTLFSLCAHAHAHHRRRQTMTASTATGPRDRTWRE